MIELPSEIIDLIANYLDYKPLHKKKFQKVLNTIHEIDRMIEIITPCIAKECWGVSSLNKYKYLYCSRYIWNPRDRSDEEYDNEYDNEYDIKNEMDFYEYGSNYF